MMMDKFAKMDGFVEHNPELNSHLHRDAGVSQVGDERLAVFLKHALKPEEISGPMAAARTEELLGWFKRYFEGNANPKWLSYHAAELAYALSRRAANTTGTVKVKALIWQGSGWPKIANTPFGQYQIWADFEVFRDGHLLQTDGLSYETAQAAAQADFASGILSSLEPASSVEVKPVAWKGTCPECGCHAKADIQRADGSPDGRVRCVNCKGVFGSLRPSTAVSAEVTELIDACQNVYDKLAGETTTVTIFDQERLGDALAALREPQP